MTPTMPHRTLTTPDGPFTIVAGADTVLAAGWTADPAGLVALIDPGLRDAPATQAAAILDAAAAAVDAYYAGDWLAPARIAVRQHAGDFHERAWAAMRLISPGQTMSYAQLAAHAGNPAAVRAAGHACATNAAALFVPCHRVVRADGRLGGFRYGLAIKASLLTREAGAGSGAFSV